MKLPDIRATLRTIRAEAIRLAHATATGVAITAAAVFAPTPLSAADPVTIPSTGIDVPGYITAAILYMGTVAAVAVGGYFAFLVVKKALVWGKKAL